MRSSLHSRKRTYHVRDIQRARRVRWAVIMHETLFVPAINVAIQAVFLYASGRSTSIITNPGHDVSHTDTTNLCSHRKEYQACLVQIGDTLWADSEVRHHGTRSLLEQSADIRDVLLAQDTERDGSETMEVFAEHQQLKACLSGGSCASLSLSGHL